MEFVKELVIENYSGLIIQNQLMKQYTTMKVGGPAKFFLTPASISDLIAALKYAKNNEIPCLIIGNGSNILVRDKGFDGIVICTKNNLNEIKVNAGTIIAQAGALLSKIANTALQHSLSGFEFAAGIPGTLGGAVYMNAGAHGGDMSRVVVNTSYLDQDLNMRTLSSDMHNFSYRHSFFKDNPDYIILESQIKLMPCDKQEIYDKMINYNSLRAQKQPLDFPNCGSTFKRPDENFAGKLIEDSGLKDYSIGGAKVSSKHAGFIVNHDNASCQDIIDLIEYVKSQVNKKFGILLECEVQIV